jgi:chromatin remodeling complex protein RSC6
MDNMPSNLAKLKENISSLKDKIFLYKNIILELSQDVQKIETNCNNYIKSINKPKKKIKKGFATPSSISKELSDFLNIPNDTKISRTDVTKQISDYIKSNNLQNENDKTEILPNEKLIKLIGNEHNDKLTFFSIQKLLNRHFIKS